MSNPVGIAPRTGPPQGLDYCGEALTGGAPNYIGSGGYTSDGGVVTETGGPGGVFYLPPTAAEPIEMYPGGGPVVPCSDAPAQARGLLTHTIYDYVALAKFPSAIATPSGSGASDAAATAVSGAACEFVTVGVGIDVNLFPGYVKCTQTLATEFMSLESFTVSMGGVALDWIGPTRRLLPDPEASHTPPVWNEPTLLEGATWFMLRPTALTWPGQDPDNQWNRALWRPSEIGALTWHIAAWAWSWDVGFPTAAYGYQRTTNYPTPCPILSGVVVPSTIAAGPGVAALLHPPPPVGADAPAATTPAPPAGFTAGAAGRVAAGAPTTGLVAQEP